jgi:hypothetical protein
MNDPDIVYIGRGSIWGNPFPMDNQSREERQRVIDQYRRYLWRQIQKDEVTADMILALDGKRLACYCAPKPCHGDVLVDCLNWLKGEDGEDRPK